MSKLRPWRVLSWVLILLLAVFSAGVFVGASFTAGHYQEVVTATD